MERNYYLDLAASGLRMPVGGDLTLQETPEPEAVKHDPVLLGEVVAGTARRYRSPLAFPLMDLMLEKADLLEFLGVPECEIDAFHFAEAPSAETVEAVAAAGSRPFCRRIAANQQAIRYIAERTDLLPVGMMIGPFSLMTKLLADPIVPVAVAGHGVTADDDAGVLLVERCLALAEATVARSAKAQIAHGARAIIVCEPAANTVYLSPGQLRIGANTFERYVLGPNRRLRQVMRDNNVDLIFHNCGELLTSMVQQFAEQLRPVILSLGSSRRLWEDAAVVPKDVVLYGNLPTKTFYSDAAMPAEEVKRRTLELLGRMQQCGHPHILGSECDVLHVPEAAATIRAKVEVMMTASASSSITG
jgi:uroporphyrinogen-III decarboxylase